jgi:hypothetical protein
MSTTTKVASLGLFLSEVGFSRGNILCLTFKRKELRSGAAGVALGASPDEAEVLTRGTIPLPGDLCYFFW